MNANPDGTFSLTQSLYPTRVKWADGSWAEVDTTLQAIPDGRVTPAATPSGVSFSPGGSGPLAILNSYGKQLAISWPTELPAPSLSGSTATYADVLPGVDLALTATPLGGFNEILVVKSAQAAANPQLGTLTLSATTQGLQLARDAVGNLAADDSSGHAFFSSPSATMWDSSGLGSATSRKADRASATASTSEPENPVPAGIEGPGTGSLTGQVTAGVSGGQITLSPDMDVLSGATTHYPVYIDPSWNPDIVGGARLAYDEVQQGCSDKNALNSTTAPYDTPGVGRNNFSGCVGVERTYYQMRVDSRLWNSATNPIHIVDATLKATELYSASCSVTSTVNAYVTAPGGVINLSTTWDNQPTQSTLQDTVSFGPACTTNPSGGFTVSDAYTKASNAHLTETTFVLRSSDETDELNFKRFSNNPSVTVTYDVTPGVTSVSTSPPTACTGGIIGNTSITLKAAVSDPDKGSPVYANLTLKNSIGTVIKTADQLGPVTQTGTLSWNVGTLLSGKYSWTAAADDLKYKSATKTCSFTVDISAPVPPKIECLSYPPISEEFPQQKDDRIGEADFNFSPGDDSTDTAGYAFNWGSRPPTIVSPNDKTYYVAASAGIATKRLKPTGLDNILFVVAIDSAGNQSPAATYEFYLTPPNLNDEQPGDITGDGQPDFITPGTEGNLHLYPGSNNGTLGSLFQISEGVDFTDALLAIGDVKWSSAPGVLARQSNGSLYYYPGNGDTEPLGSSPIVFDPPGGEIANWSNVTHLSVASGVYGGVPGDVNLDTDGPDIFATTTDGTLWFIPAGESPGALGEPIQLATGWQGKTIAAAGPYQGHEALWGRNDATGELDLYLGDGTANIIPGSSTSTKVVAKSTGLTGAAYPQLFPSPAAGTSEYPGLWAQSTNSTAPKVTFYPGTTTGALGNPTTPQTLAAVGAGSHADTIGVYRPGDQSFNLRNSNSGGDDFSVTPFNTITSSDRPVRGDWNGDKVDTIGTFNPNTHIFSLRNSNSPGGPLTVNFGSGGDIPISGDWNGDGKDTIGVYRPTNNTFYLRNTNNDGVADISFVYGASGDIPITGDWNGDGIDSIGVYRPTTDTFYQRNSNTAGGNDAQFIFGSPGDKPVVGDWTGHGSDTVGVWRPTNRTFYLHNANASGQGDVSFAYGEPDDLPMAGDWSGR